MLFGYINFTDFREVIPSGTTSCGRVVIDSGRCSDEEFASGFQRSLRSDRDECSEYFFEGVSTILNDI